MKNLPDNFKLGIALIVLVIGGLIMVPLFPHLIPNTVVVKDESSGTCMEQVWEISRSDKQAAGGDEQAAVEIAKSHGQTYDHIRPCITNTVN
ncbi:hypothetical protein ACWG8W_06390 [Citricoccus zhacaiensis]